MVVLTGCSSGTDDGDATADPGAGESDRRIEASDGSFTIEIPEGWASREEFLQGSVVVAAQGEDEIGQLLISVFDDVDAAEGQAIYTAAGLASSDVACKRQEDSTVFGDARLVFDCPQKADGSTVRRLFIPVEHDGASILVLVQTSAESLAETAAVVTPMLESLTFA